MNRHFSAKNLTLLCLASALALSPWVHPSSATDGVTEAGRRIARAGAQLRGAA
ncbi:hypothetical protein ACCD00_21605 [Pseudomonas sp. Pseusp3]|uniref:hypothetical protein n=1 Tax=Pseudomonas sp. Pseusp3 TaxID=3243029 RepID=UPI0039B02A9E